MALGLLAGICAAAAPALAQSSYYPSARKLNDNGSVTEPGPVTGNATPYGNRSVAGDSPGADDNGSDDEPGPGH
jgi:hypothetical protein